MEKSLVLPEDSSWLFKEGRVERDFGFENDEHKSVEEGTSLEKLDLSQADTSRVKNMKHMFNGAVKFNQDISSWDTSNVENMSWMFSYALSFNQDISSWDVSSVKAMRGMFTTAVSFNQDISSWDVSNVEKMGRMFHEAESFNQDLSSWSVDKIKLGNAKDFDREAGFEGKSNKHPNWYR